MTADGSTRSTCEPEAAIGRMGPVGGERPVALVAGIVYDAAGMVDEVNGAFLQEDGPQRVLDAARGARLPVIGPAASLDHTTHRLGPPIASPSKIVCIGLNYHAHARETGAEPPSEPVVFMKDPGCIVGAFDEVLIPRGSTKTDWEIELAVVIGRTARYLASPEHASDHVAGYCISNDLSEREFQLERGGQWDKGKSCETFNPLGPWFVPRTEIADPQALTMRLWVNGVERQVSTTADMIFPIDHVVWYLSQFMVLRPGDVINTGTPAGVALGRSDTPYLRTGDEMELAITGLGVQRQRVR